MRKRKGWWNNQLTTSIMNATIATDENGDVNVTSVAPGRYVLEQEVVVSTIGGGEATPPLPDVIYNGTGYYIDGEIEGNAN